MIKYKCVYCGVELETDDTLSGKQEPCPDCGKANIIPLSKNDVAKQKAQQKAQEKEKLQQERDERLREEEAKQRKFQEYAAKKQRQLAKERLGMSSTEDALAIFAYIYIFLGALAAIILIGTAVEYSQPLYVLGALMALATSVLWAVLFFAVRWVLQYLRRITNAIEGGK